MRYIRYDIGIYVTQLLSLLAFVTSIIHMHVQRLAVHVSFINGYTRLPLDILVLPDSSIVLTSEQCNLLER